MAHRIKSPEAHTTYVERRQDDKYQTMERHNARAQKSTARVAFGAAR